MLFNEVVAQDDIKDNLLQAVNAGRLSHALLFLGPTGYGTLSMAVALAQFLLCTNRSDEGACGVCNHCHKAGQYIHPDIHFTYPTIGAKATSGDFLPAWRNFLRNGTYQDVQDWYRAFEGEGKQGNITKNECDRILKILGLKTYEGSHKVLIIWMVEFLGDQGNRLLKILEEPPENTVFILLAESQEKILNTILSRCQMIPFKPVPDASVVKYLQQKNNLDEDTATQIAFLARGNINTAISLAQHADDKIAELWLDWMRVAYKGYGPEINPWVDQFAKLNRESQKTFMYYGLHFLREMMLYHLDHHHRVHLLDNEKDAMIKISRLLDYPAIESMVSLVEENIFHLERNINSKILLLDSSIRMHYLLRNEETRLKAMLSL
jgi:DNA polymerase III subunit delta'